MSDPFNRDHTPKVGQLLQLTPDIGVITAPNGSPMTFTGTQTYFIGQEELAIVDPGPENEDHLNAILSAIGGRVVSHILITHSHVDHSPLSRRLSHKVNAPILAFGSANEGRSSVMERLAQNADLGGAEGIDKDFKPDGTLKDGQNINGQGWSVQAIHTPGHLSNHLCFAVNGTGVVLTGDHIMGWATTMVSPPDGDLTDFMASMEKMKQRTQDKIYFPGHGGPVTDPQGMVKYQITHRKGREQQILDTLAQKPESTPLQLVENIYTNIDQRLFPAAARNVFAHLIDLSERKIVHADRPISPDAKFFVK